MGKLWPKIEPYGVDADGPLDLFDEDDLLYENTLEVNAEDELGDGYYRDKRIS